MSDDSTSKPSGRFDEARFRQALFGAALDESGAPTEGRALPDAPARDEDKDKARSGPMADPAARPATGYKSPPLATRFAKGQSGNPKGRPRKQRVAHPPKPSLPTEILNAELNAMVTLRDADGVRQVTAYQAILLAERQSAAKGNAIAQRNHLNRLEQAERNQQEAIASEHELAEAYIQRCRAEIARAASRGEPPPRHIPHPDDIRLSPGEPVQFVRPVNEEQLLAIETMCSWRDLLLMLGIWEVRCGFHDRGTTPQESAPAATVFAILFDRELPIRRFCLAPGEREAREDRYLTIPLHTLEAKLHAAWAGIGRPVARLGSCGRADRVVARLNPKVRRQWKKHLAMV